MLQDLLLYDFEFKYISGSTNILADYFSRINYSNDQKTLHENYNLINCENPFPISIDLQLRKTYHCNNAAAE